jgi:hypothetical protein
MEKRHFLVPFFRFFVQNRESGLTFCQVLDWGEMGAKIFDLYGFLANCTEKLNNFEFSILNFQLNFVSLQRQNFKNSQTFAANYNSENCIKIKLSLLW